MIHDLHSHTYYSMCGRDDPHALCDAAIKGGIELLGISDHNYGIRPERFASYRAEIAALREEYRGKLTILCGIEICTLPCWSPHEWGITDTETLADFDYCLIEHLDRPDSLLEGDLLSFATKRTCTVGIAHTDLFGFCQAQGLDPLAYFTSLAQNGIFWELNVNYDSIHAYNEHAYVKTFFSSPEQIAIIKQSGIALSVGFDGHRIEDYAPERIHAAHEKLRELGIRTVI